MEQFKGISSKRNNVVKCYAALFYKNSDYVIADMDSILDSIHRNNVPSNKINDHIFILYKTSHNIIIN